jgi:hypothetical protein
VCIPRRPGVAPRQHGIATGAECRPGRHGEGPSAAAAEAEAAVAGQDAGVQPSGARPLPKGRPREWLPDGGRKRPCSACQTAPNASHWSSVTVVAQGTCVASGAQRPLPRGPCRARILRSGPSALGRPATRRSWEGRAHRALWALMCAGCAWMQSVGRSESRWGAPYSLQLVVLFVRSLKTRRFESLSTQDFATFLIVGVLCGECRKP